MGRVYDVCFEEITIAAAQDLFEVYFGTSIYKALRILRQWINCSDTTVPAGVFLPLRSRILASTVTNGTGGAAAIVKPHDNGNSAASFTAHANNTAKATTTGSEEYKREDGFHIYQGHEFMWNDPPIIIGGQNQSFVFELLAVPASFSVKFSGGLEVEELG